MFFGFGSLLGSWQWKAEAPSPKWEMLSKARFWTVMGNTHPKHGSSMDLGRLRAQLASPLTEVKSAESGKVDVVNIEVTGKVVKMLYAPYKDPQDPLKFLEALDSDMIILNANLVDGADPVSPVVMAKLIDNPETVRVIYSEVEPVWDALQTVLETPGNAENDYWYEKVQVCYWLPGAGKTGKGGIQVKPLVLMAGVKIKKKVCTALLDCEASQCLCHLAPPHYRSYHTSVWVAANVMNQGSCPLCFISRCAHGCGGGSVGQSSASLVSAIDQTEAVGLGTELPSSGDAACAGGNRPDQVGAVRALDPVRHANVG